MEQSSKEGARRDVEARLVERAVRDAAFRAELLSDPKGAVERELSSLSGGAVKLPAHVRVAVHEETADTYHLVLAPVPESGGDLSDADLAGVAGGAGTLKSGCGAGCTNNTP